MTVTLNTARRGKTDWAYVDSLTDEQIKTSVADDPDWANFQDLDWTKAVAVEAPRKKPISIRVDEDVLDFFKEQGAGYQRRMNAVLRAFVTEIRKRSSDEPRSKKKAG